MVILPILILFLLINRQIAYVLDEVNAEDIFLEEKYIEMDNALKDLVRKSIKGFLYQFLEAGEQMNLSSNCITNIFQLIAGVRYLRTWAISFLDASGKLTDGFISGNSHMLGNYDQCLSTSTKKKNGEIGFQGRYCLITYKPFLPDPRRTPTLNGQIEKVYAATRNVSELLQLYAMKSQLMSYYSDKYGLCVPSGCGRTDVEQITKHVGKTIYLNLTVQYCHVEADTPKLDKRRIIIICVFASFGFLSLIGTIIDYYSKAKDMKIKNGAAKVLLCFSVMTNFPRLINTDMHEKALSCISGIRVLTIFYIMLGHHYVSKNLFYLLTNAVPAIFIYIPSFFTQIVLNGFLNVEVFFLLGGFINSYLRIKAAEMGKSSRNVWMIILHRLWRIYPSYIFSILLVLLLTARGPLSPKLEETYIEKCAQEWWKNILFINNFFDQATVCLVHSWYLACDMQYFLISLVTIPLLIRSPKKGILVNVAIILWGLISTALWVGLKKVPPTFLFRNVSEKDMLSSFAVYISPFSHVAPYFIGLLMGYILSTKKDIKIPKVYQVVGWMLAGLLYTSMLFMTMRWNSAHDYTRAESVLYFTFSKALYALAIAWMIFCCITGHGGIINYILSLKFWIPLSRISYTLFLISFPMQLFYQANLRTTTDAHVMILIWEYFGDLCVCCLLALALVILTESPLLSLEKLVFQETGSESKQQHLRQGSMEVNGHQGNAIHEIVVENERNAIENNIQLSGFK